MFLLFFLSFELLVELISFFRITNWIKKIISSRNTFTLRKEILELFRLQDLFFIFLAAYSRYIPAEIKRTRVDIYKLKVRLSKNQILSRSRGKQIEVKGSKKPKTQKAKSLLLSVIRKRSNSYKNWLNLEILISTWLFLKKFIYAHPYMLQK